ncbi:MAG: serine hydroxymethyltransferase, partial [Zestosphaera sp.]
MTRLGMKEGDFKEVAKFMREVLIDGRPPEEVRKKVVEFRKNFVEVKYGFNVPEELEKELTKIPILL